MIDEASLRGPIAGVAELYNWSPPFAGDRQRRDEKTGIKLEIMTATGAAAVMLLSQAAHANTMVSTIIGAYDAQCTSTCPGIMPAGVSHYVNNSPNSTYDTLSLFILNPTSSPFTNVSLTLTGYQDYANGGTGATEQSGLPGHANASGPPITQTLTLPTIAAHTVYQLVWDGAGTEGGNSSLPGGSIGVPSSNPLSLSLFAYDYDSR